MSQDKLQDVITSINELPYKLTKIHFKENIYKFDAQKKIRSKNFIENNVIKISNILRNV